MSNQQHTPGPWKVVKTENKHRHVIYSCVCKVTEINTENSFHDGIGLGEGIANARLIAAAPELLEALRHMIYAVEDLTHGDAEDIMAVKEARAAIAKARGES